MSLIVTSIVKVTVGLLWNKVLDATAKNLRVSGNTNAIIRELVLRELEDIRRKLDGLSRKDLLSSYSFLQEGIQLLNVCLEKSEQTAVLNEGNDNRGETSKMPSGGESRILNEALELSQAMGKLQIVSYEFEAAKKRFEDARKEATRAFCNEALNIQDRIFAAKLRIVAEILEYLNTPDTVATSCLVFLQKIHALPAVRQAFSGYLSRGINFFQYRTVRAENVKSVMMINHVLYQFLSKFSSKYCSPLAWPTIQLSDRSFNPICNWQDVSAQKSWGEDLIQPPNVISFDKLIPFESTMNSRGEIVSIIEERDDMTVTSEAGTTTTVRLFPLEDKEAVILGFALGEENNIHVLQYERNSENLDGYAVLCILDEQYTRVKHKTTLLFLPKLDKIRYKVVAMAVKNSMIVMTLSVGAKRYVYVCDNTGQLKHEFELELGWRPTLVLQISISDEDEIMLAPNLKDNVYVYTKEGELKLTIKPPARHKVCGAIFHLVIHKIIVLSYFEEESSCFLHFYSETGELENSMGFSVEEDLTSLPKITSHPSGPVAIVGVKSITYL